MLLQASSKNGKVKLLLTYSTKRRARVLHILLKDRTFVTNVFSKNPLEHELHLTSMTSTQNSPSFVQHRPQLHLYITVRDGGVGGGWVTPVHKYMLNIHSEEQGEMSMQIWSIFTAVSWNRQHRPKTHPEKQHWPLRVSPQKEMQNWG